MCWQININFENNITKKRLFKVFLSIYYISKISKLLAEGKNDEALLLYDELGEYEDASSIASETRYNMAFDLLNKEKSSWVPSKISGILKTKLLFK